MRVSRECFDFVYTQEINDNWKPWQYINKQNNVLTKENIPLKFPIIKNYKNFIHCSNFYPKLMIKNSLVILRFSNTTYIISSYI